MADARVRKVVGAAITTCALCGVREQHSIIESRDRRHGLARLGGGDLNRRFYAICPTCHTRSLLRDVDIVALDLRDD